MTASKPSLYQPCRSLTLADPFRWLGMGWRDYRATLLLSISYGLFFALGGLAISTLVWFYTNNILLFGFGGLFVLLGPLFAFGLYDVSRELQLGKPPSLWLSVQQVRRSAPNQWVFACVLIVIGLVWMRAATIIHVFYPEHAEPTMEELLTFFTIGTSVGAFFAALVFGISAFSLPLMVDRNVDSITACLSSLNAVMSNKLVASLWAFMILGMIILGFATAFFGLILVLPLIGYASFHAAQDAIPRPVEMPIMQD